MKRSRGRGRKPSNPANRSYESNGPDVKIRGNANQIFEKYQQYARDAQTAGDRINAEAYLQHAEHYYRVMAANQPKERPQQNDDNDQDDRSNDETVEEANAKDGSDPLKVVDADTSDADDADVETADSGAEETKAAEKPRRRTPRSKYRTRSSEERAAANASDGEAAETGRKATKANADADDAGLKAMMARTADVKDVGSDSDNPEPAAT